MKDDFSHRREAQLPGSDDGSERGRSGWRIVCLLIAAAVLRIWFAWHQLDEGRFWDERYSLSNVASVLEKGRPNRALYPSLSYLPHTLVLAASEGAYAFTGYERFGIFSDREGRRFSPTGYLLSRLVSVAFGVWSLWLLFVLGRRLFGVEVALLAVLFLATHWRHVTASGEFKPDSVALALILLAFGWSLDAVQCPTRRNFLLAGVGVGLATAAKYNAAGISIGLVVGVFVSGWNSRRLWEGLVLAGVASLATFSLLNPWWSMVLMDFDWQLRYYERVVERRGGVAGRGHSQVLWSELEFLVRHHGVLIVGFLVAGSLGLARQIFERREKFHELAMVLGFVFGYSVLYAGVTELFLSQNYLPVIPFTSLIAAWAGYTGWEWLARWFPQLKSRGVRGLVGAAVLVLCFRFPVLSTYSEVVPTTSEAAAAFLRAKGPKVGSVVIYEGGEKPIQVMRAGHRVPALRFERLQEVDVQRLDRADAEVFPFSRLEGEEGEFYLRRLAGERVVKVERFKPRWFVARGPELVVLLHPWRQLGEPTLVPFRRLEGRERCVADLSGLAQPGDIFSLAVTRSQGREEADKVVRLAFGQELEMMYRTRADDERSQFRTQRLEFKAKDSEVTLPCEGDKEVPTGQLMLWRPT